MLEKVLNAIKRFSLIEEGDTVTVALSGGADSVALLHALLSLKDELSITVNAAHLNHGIRGDEADRDEAFVKKLCNELNVSLSCEKLDVPAVSREKHISLELAAREVRYDFLSRNASGLIATAHTASDNAETLLFNLTRGSGIKGLCGIPPKRERFIRPLILCSRADIEKYCSENGLSFVTDSTNLTDDYTRNKIRHNAVTVLKDVNPSFEDAVSRTVSALSEDNLALDYYANELLFKSLSEGGLLTKGLKNAPAAVAKRVIVKYLESLYTDLTLDYFHLNALYEICINGGKISLPNKLYGICKDDILSFDDGECEALPEFYVEIVKSQKVNNLLSNDAIDCDKIVGDLKIRTRREGDTIRLKNRGCTKTLNKLFTENKVPTSLRDVIPVVCDDNGVVWVYGMGVSQKCAATANSKNVAFVRSGVIE
ncbi:MAG: tRNA lysidine(34) synthetase TilS [Ruminococcaceae bacterium]|nr:tRNA lysidine(34) synthetase TilS [Oscillospiraceae bacterium]